MGSCNTCCCCCTALNLVGVVFTGMEHSLHIAATMVIVYGITVFLDEGRVPWWLILAIVLGPLLRYEGLALSLAAVGVLFIRGARRPALLASAGIIATLGSFTAALIAMGLEPLPSSVLVKSNVAASATDGSILSLITGFFWKIYVTLYNRVGILLAVAWLVTATWVVFIRQPSRQQFSDSKVLVALTLLAVTGAHIIAGRYGWFYRYEIYVIVATVMLGLYLMQDGLRALLVRPFGKLGVLSVGASALIIIGTPYLNAVAREVPVAANNIYEQHYQLHRFITEFYKGPVAVNDLGWTSYRNPYYVLDLLGLGSETVRKHRLKKGIQTTWIKRLVAKHDINLAIIYKGVLGKALPVTWTPVGTLYLSRQKITPTHAEVTFFAARSDVVDDLRTKLRTFRSTLPPGVRLEIF